MVERPREKAIKQGITSLSNRELLAVLLRCGAPGTSSLALADEILQQAQGLAGLASMTPARLQKIRGISQVKSLEIVACFELARRMALEHARDIDVVDSPEQLIQWLKLEIGGKQQEHFIAVYLDAKNHILDYTILFKGTLDASIVHPREVFKQALLVSACRILAVHNHPSQDLTPSTADQLITDKLRQTGELMGIELLDHLIVSASQYFSFRAHGLLD